MSDSRKDPQPDLITGSGRGKIVSIEDEVDPHGSTTASMRQGQSLCRGSVVIQSSSSGPGNGDLITFGSWVVDRSLITKVSETYEKDPLGDPNATQVCMDISLDDTGTFHAVIRRIVRDGEPC